MAGGASGIAPGLLHPYVGEVGRRSLYATEGLAATNELLRVSEDAGGERVCLSQGIFRFAMNEAQVENFSQHALDFGDILQTDSSYLVTSGRTVHCQRYLKGLYRAIENRGGRLVQEKVSHLGDLASFDQIVLAAGAGVWEFAECAELPIRSARGQILTCQSPELFLEKSLIGNGYVAMTECRSTCHLGSTYEKGTLSDVPDVESARAEVLPKILSFFPEAQQLSIVDCKAAIRVVRTGHYAPLIGRLGKSWVFTGLGSRGLLYHAFLGKILAQALIAEDQGIIPPEFQCREFQWRRS